MAHSEQFLSKKYEKWNNFVVRDVLSSHPLTIDAPMPASLVNTRSQTQDSDDEDDQKQQVPRLPTQFEVTGDGAGSTYCFKCVATVSCILTPTMKLERTQRTLS